MLAAALVVSFAYEWRLALMMLTLTPVSCAIMALLAQKTKGSTMKELNYIAQAGIIAEESIMGVRTVQAFNGQDEMVTRYRTELSKGTKHGIRTEQWGGFLMGSLFFLTYAFLGTGILFGSYLLQLGIMSNPGHVFICISSQFLGIFFIGLISPHLMTLLNARVAAAVIYETIDRIPKDSDSSIKGKRLENPLGKVEFKNVQFRYPGRKDAQVLDGFSFTVEPGQTVALVGHSGCGKSTAVGLLTRLYDFDAGSITIDGVDVRDLNLQHLRQIIGIVQQEPTLFNDTIAENIRICNPQISMDGLIEVCKMANAHEFIISLPKGYNTRIGDGGIQLSGGQKQRIAIARTLARNPKILLLDEATSALDAESEGIVQGALENAAKGRTTLVIAHRLSTIQNADKIVLLSGGQIVEQGTHLELISAAGHYANLVKAQMFMSEFSSPKGELLHRDRDRGMSVRSGEDEFRRSASHSVASGFHDDQKLGSLNVVAAFEDTASKSFIDIAGDSEVQLETENYNITTIYKNAVCFPSLGKPGPHLKAAQPTRTWPSLPKCGSAR